MLCKPTAFITTPNALARPSSTFFSRTPRRSRAHHPTVVRPRSIVRALASTTTSVPLSPSPDADRISDMKKRSIITLRGLSDLAGLAILSEVMRRVFFIQCPAYAFSTDAELLLGGLMGLWTAAVFAGREKQHSDALASKMRDLPSMWDSSFIYYPDVEADEIPAMLTWLVAFDELEGVGAIEFLRAVVQSPDHNIRTRLALALSSFPTRSNVILSILVSLTNDSHPRVQSAAFHTLMTYCSVGIITMDNLPTLMSNDNYSVIDDPDIVLRHEDLSLLKLVFDRVLSNPKPVPMPLLPNFFNTSSDSSQSYAQYMSWINNVIAKQVSSMQDVALSQPELPALSSLAPGIISQHPIPSNRCDSQTDFDRHRISKRQSSVSAAHQTNDSNLTGLEHYNNVDIDSLRSAAPLVDSLIKEEIHGICALALIPAAYEILSSLQQQPLPLRFLGLGWLLTVGGMAAYPNSARLWSSFSVTIQRESRHR